MSSERQKTLGQKCLQPGNTCRKRHETTMQSWTSTAVANNKDNHTQMTPRSIFRMQRLQMLPEQKGVTGFWNFELAKYRPSCSDASGQASRPQLLLAYIHSFSCWTILHKTAASNGHLMILMSDFRFNDITWSATHSECRRLAINNSWASLVHWKICAVAAALHILQYLCQGVGGQMRQWTQIWKLGANSKPLSNQLCWIWLSSISTAQPRAFSSLSHHPCRIPNLEVLHPDLSSHTSGSQSNLHVNSRHCNFKTGSPTGKTMLEGSQRRCGRRKGLLQHLVPAQDQNPKTSKKRFLQLPYGGVWNPVVSHPYVPCFSMNEQLLAAEHAMFSRE